MSRNWPKTIKRIFRRKTSYYWNAAKIFSHFESDKLPHLKVLKDHQLIDYLVENNMSLIRWGDGESSALYGNDLMFQDYDRNLKKEMIHLLEDHKTNNRFVLGINYQFICFTLNEYKNQSIKRQKMWRTTRFIMHKYCEKDIVYGDTLLFRPYSNVENSDFKKLWGNKCVVLVSPETEHAEKIYERTDATSVHHIKIPPENCYSLIDQLESKILETIKGLEPDNKDIRILISGGPAGKVLGHRLIKMGHIVYDVGNYFTWKVDGKTNKKGI